ncbi:MAG: hypothetical protein H6667_25530 [Ardenticatenaceae bacterium]|nr:hypothetical protein [Ardenticatenaceae bacterium]
MKKAPRDNYTIQHKMRATKAMLFLLNRRQELTRLIIWAKEKEQSRQAKKYSFIQKSYQAQRDSTLQKLFLLRVRFPVQYWLARILHSISHLSSPNPVYYAGSASIYSRRGKTGNTISTSGKGAN